MCMLLQWPNESYSCKQWCSSKGLWYRKVYLHESVLISLVSKCKYTSLSSWFANLWISADVLVQILINSVMAFQNTSVSPNGKLLAVLGDSTECLLADAQSGKVVSTLKGHLDYSFASAWHPDGWTFATGNQDTTCRLWDIRNLSNSVSVLNGRMGAIRAIRFTSDGRFMAMAEPADFVHIFDTKSDYTKCQEIDLFGEIAGISFSPDTEALFIGVADRTYGSLLEFNRKHYHHYLGCIF